MIMNARRQPILLVLLAAPLTLQAAQDDGDPERRPTRITEEVRRLVEADASTPLDARIDETKITTMPTPQTPETVLLPTAPVHRIATVRDETDLDERTWNAANRSLRRGLAWLEADQSVRGAWMEGERVEATDQPPRQAAASIAVTAMGLKAFAQADLNDPASRQARDRALSFVR